MRTFNYNIEKSDRSDRTSLSEAKGRNVETNASLLRMGLENRLVAVHWLGKSICRAGSEYNEIVYKTS
jgi:hypothetical protein